MANIQTNFLLRRLFKNQAIRAPFLRNLEVFLVSQIAGIKLGGGGDRFLLPIVGAAFVTAIKNTDIGKLGSVFIQALERYGKY